MTNTKQVVTSAETEQWEEKNWTKAFHDLMSELGISQDSRYRVEEFIRDLLAKKEAEYEKVRNGLHRYYIRANNKSLEQLKQQHRKELEEIYQDISDNLGYAFSDDPKQRADLKDLQKHYQNKLTNLLEQKGK